jgi:hypothetical protein
VKYNENSSSINLCKNLSNKAIKSIALATAIISIFSIFFGGVETID